MVVLCVLVPMLFLIFLAVWVVASHTNPVSHNLSCRTSPTIRKASVTWSKPESARIEKASAFTPVLVFLPRHEFGNLLNIPKLKYKHIEILHIGEYVFAFAIKEYSGERNLRVCGCPI